MGFPSVAQSPSKEHPYSAGAVDTTTKTPQAQINDLDHAVLQVGNEGYDQANKTAEKNTTNNTSNKSGENGGGIRATYDRYLGNTTDEYVDGLKQVGAAGGNVAQGDLKNASKNLGNAKDNYSNAVTSIGQGAGKAKSDAVNATENALPSGFGLSVNIATGWWQRGNSLSSDLIDDFGWMLVSLPAPGETFDPGTWYPGYVSPINSTMVDSTTNRSTMNNTTTDLKDDNSIGIEKDFGLPDWLTLQSWWKSAWGVYAGLSLLVTGPLIVLGVFAWAQPGRREHDKRLRDVITALLLVVGGVIIMPGILHASNILATGALPSGQELLSTPGNKLKLGLGLMYLFTGTVILIMFSTFIQWMITFFVASLWPLYAALWASNSATGKAYSKLGFSMLGLLIGVRLLQSLWLRFLFFLPLDLGDPFQSIISLIVIIIGLLIAFVVIPLYALTKIVPSFIVNIVKSGGKMWIYKK